MDTKIGQIVLSMGRSTPLSATKRVLELEVARAQTEIVDKKPCVPDLEKVLTADPSTLLNLDPCQDQSDSTLYRLADGKSSAFRYF